MYSLLRPFLLLLPTPYTGHDANHRQQVDVWAGRQSSILEQQLLVERESRARTRVEGRLIRGVYLLTSTPHVTLYDYLTLSFCVSHFDFFLPLFPSRLASLLLLLFCVSLLHVPLIIISRASRSEIESINERVMHG